jgi:CYTH domain-containing protein
MEKFDSGIILLRLDANDDKGSINFPPCVKIGKDVTDDDNYSTQSLCKIKN